VAPGKLFTKEEEKIVYEVNRELLAQKQFHAGDLWIIERALDAAKLRKTHPQPPEWPFPELRKVCAAMEMIKNSQFSFVLNPSYEDVLRLGAQTPNDRGTVEKLTEHLLQSDVPGQFISALILLDARPAAKPTNYVDHFFAYLISEWFERTKGKANWKLVSKIIAMCFGANKSGTARKKPAKPRNDAKNLEQRCREFIAKFPAAAAAAETLYATAMNVRITIVTP